MPAVTLNRETVYAALFATATAALAAQVPNTFAMTGRRLPPYQRLLAFEAPAFFQAQREEEVVLNSSGIPSHRRLHVDWWVYVWESDDMSVSPATRLNAALDALEAAIKPIFPGAKVQLGVPDVVRHTFIEGTIRTDEGTLGNRALACVPVVVVVA